MRNKNAPREGKGLSSSSVNAACLYLRSMLKPVTLEILKISYSKF